MIVLTSVKVVGVVMGISLVIQSMKLTLPVITISGKLNRKIT